MAIYINGATFQSNNSVIKIAANEITGLDFNSSDCPSHPQRPYFIAQGNTASWSAITVGWNTYVLSSEVIDNGANYNTGTGAFTAPISGTYWFSAHMYVNKATAVATDYCTPTFAVNGSLTTKHAENAAPYRLRGRTHYAGAYDYDTELNDIFYLTAGDYVTMYNYNSGADQWYKTYAIFCGFLIG